MQINDKNSLRKHFKSLRTEMTAEQKQDLDKRISDNFILSQFYKDHNDFYVYVSSDIEVDTRAIIEKCFADGKCVYAPRCVKGTNLMHFYRINSFDDLEVGSFGILEPKSACHISSSCGDDSICIVPALAFEHGGYRLGFGKGFYDRFLNNFNGTAVGLSYEFCFTDKLVIDQYDRPVNAVVTENKTYYLNAFRKD